MTSRSAALVAILWSLGCTSPPPAVESGPGWAVGPTPLFSIGDSEAKPGHELAGVSGARMQAGRVIIANMSSSQLRIFDSTGTLITTVGRKGEGPGEFRASMFLFPAPGDSLYVFDTGNLRYSMHDPQGNYVRVLPRGADAVQQPTWLYRRTVVESNTPGQSPAWVVRLLDGMPEALPGTPVRRAKFDDLGYLWVSDSGRGGRWTVYADSAAPIGVVSLRLGFQLLQAGRDFVLGLERDSLGRELVRGYSLRRGVRVEPRGATADLGPPTHDAAAEAELKTSLRNLTTAQEMHYAQHASYTAAADSLLSQLPSGVELVIMAADPRHWHGILYDPKRRITCGMSIGFPAPPGWVDGTVFCGR